jgi:hypothetical protein
MQAGKYVDALVSGLPKRNGWTIAEHAGDRAPDRTQRLLSRSSQDTFAAMGVVRVAGPVQDPVRECSPGLGSHLALPGPGECSRNALTWVRNRF